MYSKKTSCGSTSNKYFGIRWEKISSTMFVLLCVFFFFFVVVVGTDQLQLFVIWIQGVTNSEHRISQPGLPSGSRVYSNKIAKLEVYRWAPGGGPPREDYFRRKGDP